MAIEGIDVSKWQGEIDWPAVVSAGKTFCILRASYGTNPVAEQTLPKKWMPATTAGMICGAYHYFLPGNEESQVRAQAQLFLSQFNEAAPVSQTAYLPAVIDIEAAADGVDNETYAERIRQWMEIVESSDRFAGRPTIIYTRQSFWREIGDPDGFSDHPLWVADYSRKPPRLPSGWNDYAFFQYSDGGSVEGIEGDVDLDEFNGTLDQLEAMTRPPAEALVS